MDWVSFWRHLQLHTSSFSISPLELLGASAFASAISWRWQCSSSGSLTGVDSSLDLPLQALEAARSSPHRGQDHFDEHARVATRPVERGGSFLELKRSGIGQWSQPAIADQRLVDST